MMVLVLLTFLLMVNARQDEGEECTCTVYKKIGITAVAGIGATILAFAAMAIPGVGKPVAYICATEAAAAGFGGAAFIATGYIVNGECQC